MSAAAPVRRPAQLRGAAALRLPEAIPSRSAPRRATTLPRPRLVLVASRRTTAGRLPFLIVVGTLLVFGLVAVLMLHMVAAQDAFRVTGLQQRLATLTDQEQQEAQLVAADSAPAALQARAVALGMEPTSITKFNRGAGGHAVGVQTPYYVPPPVTVAPRTTKAGSHKSARTSKTTSTTTSKTTSKTTTKSPAAGKTATPPKSTTHKPKHPKPGQSHP